jgi:hypothetical protein
MLAVFLPIGAHSSWGPVLRFGFTQRRWGPTPNDARSAVSAAPRGLMAVLAADCGGPREPSSHRAARRPHHYNSTGRARCAGIALAAAGCSGTVRDRAFRSRETSRPRLRASPAGVPAEGCAGDRSSSHRGRSPPAARANPVDIRASPNRRREARDDSREASRSARKS